MLPQRELGPSFGGRSGGWTDPGFPGLSGNPPVPRRSLVSLFPRKREPRLFSRLLWAPAFAGATIGEGCRFDYNLFSRRDSGRQRFMPWGRQRRSRTNTWTKCGISDRLGCDPNIYGNHHFTEDELVLRPIQMVHDANPLVMPGLDPRLSGWEKAVVLNDPGTTQGLLDRACPGHPRLPGGRYSLHSRRG
jgi:hypothetical protein